MRSTVKRWAIRLGLICPHHWRPAVTSKSGPARWCDMCGRREDLTQGEFYAYFGRIAR